MGMEHTFDYRPDFFAKKTVDDAAAGLNALKSFVRPSALAGKQGTVGR
ncbi:hypothetical protein NOVOSPHI9U_310019 [Novosphingobium sp. 9U]|nr:hypothetical protein NOVOSPHI9U_310019 [Novosphingobium sp. 9U]